MNAALVSQNPKDGLPTDFEDDFLETTQLRTAAFQFLDFEPARFGISGVHPVKVSGEQTRFVATRPGSDLHDRVAILVRLRREQRVLNRLRKSADLILQNR